MYGHTRSATSYLQVPRSSSLLIPYRIYRNNLFRRICHKIYPTRTTSRHQAHAKRTHSHVRASRADRALLIRIRTRDSVCKLRYPVVMIVSRGQWLILRTFHGCSRVWEFSWKSIFKILYNARVFRAFPLIACRCGHLHREQWEMI